MAKRKKSLKLSHKIILIILVAIILAGLVFFGRIYSQYVAQKNLQEAISQNVPDSDKFDYSGTKIENTGTKNLVTYSRLGTGFKYDFSVNTNLEIDSDNSEKLPNLMYKNIMPYTDSIITFSYFHPDDNVPAPIFRDLDPNDQGSTLSKKKITVDGHQAQITEIEDNYAGYSGDNSSYTYHIYVVVEDVNQGVRRSSNRVEIEPKKFIIHGETGNTTDERARNEIKNRVNEIIPTLKFTQN